MRDVVEAGCAFGRFEQVGHELGTMESDTMNAELWHTSDRNAALLLNDTTC